MQENRTALENIDHKHGRGSPMSLIEYWEFEEQIKREREKTIRDDEREKVLDEIFHRICQLKGAAIFSSVDFGDVMHVYEDMKKELRQQGEQ